MNTIQIKRRLVQSGIEEPQAEGIAEEIGNLEESTLATKKDLSRWALRIVLANAAVTAALLALYGFAA